MKTNNIEIITVNYNTPKLISRLIDSRDKYSPNVVLRIIDGSDNKKYSKDLLSVLKDKNNVILYSFGYNIHHGNGLNYGLQTSKSKYTLAMDSDSVFINDGGIEYLISIMNASDSYMVANMCYVDGNGYDINGHYKGDRYYYPHPSICLINTEKYKSSEYRYINHGAPAINIAIGLYRSGLSNTLVHAKDLYKYFNPGCEGTVKLFGYNLTHNNIGKVLN